jgi:hypothetical protein
MNLRLRASLSTKAHPERDERVEHLLRFAIWKDTIDGVGEIDILKSDYDSIKVSRSILSSVREIEQKVYQIFESYASMQSLVFDVSLRRALYSYESVIESNLSADKFSISALNFLTHVGLYLDTMQRHMREICGWSEEEAALQHKKITGVKFDSHFEYRISESLRNHAKHYKLVANSSFYEARWNDERSKLGFSSKYFFVVSEEKELKKFRPDTKRELLQKGGKIDLVDCFKVYFSCICDIHNSLRQKLQSIVELNEANLERYRKIWRDSNPDEMAHLISIVAGALKDGNVYKEVRKISLSYQVDEYRKYLSQRTYSLDNMASRHLIL